MVMVFAFKVAGAKADLGGTLDEVEAVARRAHKLRTSRASGVQGQLDLRQWRVQYAALDGDRVKRHLGSTPALETLRWMIEEYGVQLFAQELRTSIPVSAKRLQQAFDAARASLAVR